ncbi:C2H2-type zinc finger protein [Salmonella enterica]|nr:C2H2-type zinc finger protein [Salmonella enterica subsp. enterica serovar Rubislaw]EGA6653336.1 C2H2-type zinc finger protein [Salmonella enterica]EKI3359855.1 C2H2-type zinc finger protein [Salmonella enterica]
MFPCSRCSRTFTSPSALVRHMRTHTEDWPANRGRDLLPWKSCPDLSVNIRRAAYPVSYLRQRLRYLLRSRYLFY